MSYQGLLAETMVVRGHRGDGIEAYYSRPLGAGPFAGVVVAHHAPGWDEWSKEVCRKLAYHGYLALMPHLYHRDGPGDPEDVAARVRSEGGVADEQVLGDLAGSLAWMRDQPYASGKVAVMGFCAGGRQAYLAGCLVPGFDAVVDCWGGGVIVDDRSTLTAKRPVPPIEYTDRLACPIIGIFGNEDRSPSADQVNRHEEILKRAGKTYEFHRWDGAGHAFFCTERPNYRQAQAVEGWQRVFAFLGRHLVSEPVAASAR